MPEARLYWGVAVHGTALPGPSGSLEVDDGGACAEMIVAWSP